VNLVNYPKFAKNPVNGDDPEKKCNNFMLSALRKHVGNLQGMKKKYLGLTDGRPRMGKIIF